ncbi:GNAT family N-acetyltransferase [Deinococcus antarcticus]|uniref:GNAT family N-acetyltransferase n=1 Tax=Deinococcus antarcticus TaxID=1298767 RepID=A0ABV8A4F7_9DEIO
MTLLERINASEVESHRLAERNMRQIGPFVVLGSGHGTPLDSAWFDGSRLPTVAELRELEEFCREAGQAVTLHALSHVSPALLPVLRAQGYTVSYVLHAYAHELRHLPERSMLDIRPEPDPEVWAQLSAQGFGPGTETIMGLVARHPRVQRLVAERNGVAMASAALQVSAGVAALYGTSTHPEYRGRGAQAALLAHRLHLAQQQGATLASVFVTPGTPSERNIQRSGFRLAGMRLTFTRQ